MLQNVLNVLKHLEVGFIGERNNVTENFKTKYFRIQFLRGTKRMVKFDPSAELWLPV